MFVGHLALGLGAKRLAPELSLGTLFFACQLPDLIWPTLVLLGIETVAIRPGDTAVTPLEFVSYPWSHSLLAVAVTALAVSLAWIAPRRSLRAACVVVTLAVSHWLLDAVSHRPDLALVPGGAARIGLGLWQSVPATLAAELAMFAAGVVIYARTTRPRDRTGTIAFAALVLFLIAVYLLNIFGPPPPGPAAVAWGAQAVWLLVLWGWWVDRHRVPR